MSDKTRNFLNVDATADELNTSVRHIRGLVSQRRIPHYKVGGLLRFDLSELNDWLEENKVEAAK